MAVDADAAAKMADLSYGEMEAVASSTRLFTNIVADKKRRNMKEPQDKA